MPRTSDSSVPNPLAANMNITASAWARLGMALVLGSLAMSVPAAAQPSGGPDTRPYDERLLRLSEILGAVHYLRELCGSNDGQAWRDRMRELMDAEGSSALRRAKLTRSFNNGYRSYGRTYNACTPSAQTAITRFLTEGSEIADGLMKAFP
jgi:uncharacterized protein (TIGR02301 family)